MIDGRQDGIKTAVGFFVVILVGALLSAALGGAFAAFLGAISPEFVKSLFGAAAGKGGSPARYACAVGMIWGLFIGAGVSAFACLLSAILKILKIRLEFKREQEAGASGG